MGARLTWRDRVPALLIVAALSACSPSFNAAGAPAPGNRALPAARTPAEPAVTEPAMALKVSGCRAPVTCTSVPTLTYVIFHGPASANAKVVITPQESGYHYGFAVEYCIQESETIDGVVTLLGDQLSECRNLDGFIDAMDNVADPKFPKSTQTIEFPGDEEAAASPKDAIYNNASFPVFPYGEGLPQNKTYGFAVKLHVHDANGNFNTVKLQWCPTSSCASV